MISTHCYVYVCTCISKSDDFNEILSTLLTMSQADVSNVEEKGTEKLDLLYVLTKSWYSIVDEFCPLRSDERAEI